MDTTTSSQKNPRLIILLVVVAIVAGYLGYWIGTKNNSTASQQPIPYVGLQADGLKLGPESIIRSQQATAVGKVAKVETSGITIQGDDGKVGVFRFASQVSIYPLAASPSAATKPSQNPSDIKVGEMVILSMNLQGNQYVVNSVSYLPKNATVK